MTHPVAEYPEYMNLDELWRAERGMLAEKLMTINRDLNKKWFCILRRQYPYSAGSRSFYQEVFLLIKRPCPAESFRGESSGRIAYVGKPGQDTVHKQYVYIPQRPPGYRAFLVMGSEPLPVCSVKHAGSVFRMFRYSFEFHCDKVTESKGVLHQHLQEFSMTIHPNFSTDYLIAWHTWSQGKGERPRVLFRHEIKAYQELATAERQAREKEQQRAIAQERRRAEEAAAKRSADAERRAAMVRERQLQEELNAAKRASMEDERQAQAGTLEEQRGQEQDAVIAELREMEEQEAAEKALQQQLSDLGAVPEAADVVTDAFANFLGDLTIHDKSADPATLDDGGGFATATAAAPPSLDDIFGVPPSTATPPAAPSPFVPAMFGPLGGAGSTPPAGPLTSTAVGSLAMPAPSVSGGVLPSAVALSLPNSCPTAQTTPSAPPTSASDPFGDMLLDCRTMDEVAKEHRDTHAKPSVLAAFDAPTKASGTMGSQTGSVQGSLPGSGTQSPIPGMGRLCTPPPGGTHYMQQQLLDPFGPPPVTGAVAMPPAISTGGAVPLSTYIPPSTSSPPPTEKRVDPFAALSM